MSTGAKCVPDHASASGAAELPQSSCRCVCQWHSRHCLSACLPRVLAVRHRRKQSVSRGINRVPNHASASGAAELAWSSCRRECQWHSRHCLCACIPRFLAMMHWQEEAMFRGAKACFKPKRARHALPSAPRSSCRRACQWRSGHCLCACKPRVLAVRHRHKESVSRDAKCVPNHSSASGAAELPRSSCRRECQWHSRHGMCACNPRFLAVMH